MPILSPCRRTSFGRPSTPTSAQIPNHSRRQFAATMASVSVNSNSSLTNVRIMPCRSVTSASRAEFNDVHGARTIGGQILVEKRKTFRTRGSLVSYL